MNADDIFEREQKSTEILFLESLGKKFRGKLLIFEIVV
jgi:hypothetical protein